MSELKDGSGDGPHLPPDKPNTTADHHLTKAPLERLSWNDVEIDDEHQSRPADRDFTHLGRPAPAESWTETRGAPVEAPQEQDLTEIDEDAGRTEKLRKVFFERAEDAHDAIGSIADSIQDALPRQPTGQPETRPPRPVYSAPPDKGIDAGDAATSLVMVGAVLGELIWSSVRHFRDRREEKGA